MKLLKSATGKWSSNISDVEGRTALLSALLLTASVYVSGFSVPVSIAVLLISLIFCPKIVRSLLTLLPMLAFFTFSSCALSGLKQAVNMGFAMLAILTSGLMVASVSADEFSLSLCYFGLPEQWAFQIGLAIRMLGVLKEDVKRCLEASKLEHKGFFAYLKALKAFSAVVVLRSVALAESLYCKGYSGKIAGELRKPGLKDFLLLLVSSIIFVLSF